MISSELRKQLMQEDKYFGITNGLQQFGPFPFGGMNQEDSRQGMQDNEFYFRENYIRLGNGKLRTVWDRGTAIYTAVGKTIVYYFFYNIGSTNYVAVFLSDGTAIQINTSSLAQTVISSTLNTFYNGTGLPICSQWGTQYLLIANNFSSNNYWVWDGSVLYSAGTISPVVTITSGGSGYGSAPTVTAFGGSGSGITATAEVTNGAVTSVIITNPGTGYLPGDFVQFAFSGGGSDSSAILQAVLTSGTIGHVQLISGGTGYTAGTYALGFAGGGGSGAAGTYTVDATLSVVSIILTNAGSGYTGSPTVSFPSGGGSGAAAIAILNPGSVSSVTVVNGGSGFTATPTLTFQGGGGTGATATPVLTAGAITSVTVTAGGSGYTSAPAIIVATGLNNAAAANASLMPFGISGSSMETFQQRVWLPFPFQTGSLINGGTFNVSAPGSFTDFATSDGGLTYKSSDAYLKAQYVNIKQSNGYLYPIGDSSVSTISNVQTTGSPPTTTFNYQNTDPQTGSSWRDSVQSYGLSILMANMFGVFGLYGGAVKKISSKMDTIFTNAIFPPTVGAITPVSAVCNIFSKKIFLLLMTIKDPFTNQYRNALLSWDEKEWFICSQTSNLTFIATQEVSSNLTAWGTDGTSLFPLFETASASLTKKLSTKLYGQQSFLNFKEALGIYFQTQDLSATTSGVAFSAINVDAEHGTYPIPTIPSKTTAGFPYFPISNAGSGDVVGVNLGLTMTTSSEDFTLDYLSLSYNEVGSQAMQSDAIHGQIETI